MLQVSLPFILLPNSLCEDLSKTMPVSKTQLWRVLYYSACSLRLETPVSEQAMDSSGFLLAVIHMLYAGSSVGNEKKMLFVYSKT
tara:strand:- start:734 stop:988 length:255 start_codon:yes stop_codon:yes gene_type:complete